MTVEFLGLPQEIQSLIVNSVDAKKNLLLGPDYWPIKDAVSKEDIASLSLCCKALRTTCLAALFRDIYVSAIIPNISSDVHDPPLGKMPDQEENDKSLHDYTHSAHLTNLARYIIFIHQISSRHTQTY